MIFNVKIQIIQILILLHFLNIKLNLKLTVNMQELLNDKQSIQFYLKRQISLPLLKNQIDRRFLKITAILQRKKTRPSNQQNNILSNKMVQTDVQSIDLLKSAQFCSQQLNVLCPSSKLKLNQIEIIPVSEGRNEKQQLIKNKNHVSLSKQFQQRNSRRHSLTYCQDQNDLPLIQSNGFTFRGANTEQSQDSNDKRQIQSSQQDRIFQKINFASDFSNIKMCNSITQEQSKMMTSFNIDQQSDNTQNQGIRISDYTDLSNSDVAKTQISQKRKLTRKIKLQGKEIHLPQPQRRIVISNECFEQMRNKANQLVQRRRKQFIDHKLRENVLKKIEQRYGEMNSN